MMEPVARIKVDSPIPLDGSIRFDVTKMLWNLGIILTAIILGPLTFNLSSFVVFVVMTYLFLMIGHSVGMHRMMIHRTFSANRFVRCTLIYVGVLVGMSGPYGIIRIHDIRDWAQRKTTCHDFFSHKRSFTQDLWWQLTSKFEFTHPPELAIEGLYRDDKFLAFCDKTWMLHQLPIAIILYYFGGWSYVVWGVFVRISVSILGHWTITYFCHNPGKQRWLVKGAAVQASNIRGLGLLTYGECWHNNHHAFPESAKIGLDKGQWDPSWWFILLLRKFNLIYDVKLPRNKMLRDDLIECK